MRALIVSVDLGSPDYQAHAQEFEMLATGAGAELVGTLKARRQRPDAAYFIGSGKVQEGVLRCAPRVTKASSRSSSLSYSISLHA